MRSSYKDLLDALDLHQNVLHAEEQAIIARDLNTVERISHLKDESIEKLTFANNKPLEHYPVFIQERISIILEKQQKNTDNFRRLHIQDNPSFTKESTSPLFKRMKQAYLP